LLKDSTVKYETNSKCIFMITGSQTGTLLFLLASSAVLGIAAKWSLGQRPTLQRRAKQTLIDTHTYVQTVVHPRRVRIYP
jgi:hypothetical protein